MNLKDFSTLLPLGAFWVCFNSIRESAKFVNEIRERVVTGLDSGAHLSLQYRKAMLFDWCLSMVGSIIAVFMFSGIILWIGATMARDHSNINQAPLVVAIVGAFPLIAGFMFIACGISDLRMMRAVLHDAESRKHHAKSVQAGT